MEVVVIIILSAALASLAAAHLRLRKEYGMMAEAHYAEHLFTVKEYRLCKPSPAQSPDSSPSSPAPDCRSDPCNRGRTGRGYRSARGRTDKAHHLTWQNIVGTALIYQEQK
jgi:hypothetical protein